MLSLLAACNRKISLKLEKGQYLLYRQSIKGKKTFSTDELMPYIKQKPNSKIVGVPVSLSIYYAAKPFHDTVKIANRIKRIQSKYDEKIKKHQQDSLKRQSLIRKKENKVKNLENSKAEGNWVMRKVGAPPVIFDSSAARISAKQLENYMAKNGCFHATATHSVDTLLNSVFVNYFLTENKRYKIGSFGYTADDGMLKRIANEHFNEAQLKINAYYNESKLLEERDRLEKLIRSYGFYDFSKKYIFFNLDTTGGKVNVNIHIKNNEKNERFVRYRVSKVKYINLPGQGVMPMLADSGVTEKKYKKIRFLYFEKFYKPKVLYNKLEIEPDTFYSYQNTENTIKNLSQLEVFRQINIQYAKDTGTATLQAEITTASNNRYQMSNEIGFSVSQGLPGPFGSITFLARNVFNGCELFDINLRGSIEGVSSFADATRIYQSQELSMGTGLTYPRFLFPVSGINRLFIHNNPRTKLQGSYNLSFRPEFRRTNTRFAATYFLTKNIYNQYYFSILDINYLQTPFIQDQFRSYLIDTLFNKQGNTLFRSFQPSLASNVNFGYTHNTFQIDKNKNSEFFRLYLESGGATLNALSRLQYQRLREALEVQSLFVYWKALADVRKYVPLSTHATYAARVSVGLANPYAGDFVLPYEKYFFSGGSNSNRAWLPRRLGPGSFANFNPDGTVNYNFEQPGLIQLEINHEYRFKMLKWLNGALFIDAGNVWMINDTEPAKNFGSEFYRQIAIGTGYGFRFDFSFLIVRLDAAYKTYDPAQKGDKWVIKNVNILSARSLVTNAVWNIAVGYPF